MNITFFNIRYYNNQIKINNKKKIIVFILINVINIVIM